MSSVENFRSGPSEFLARKKFNPVIFSSDDDDEINSDVNKRLFDDSPLNYGSGVENLTSKCKEKTSSDSDDMDLTRRKKCVQIIRSSSSSDNDHQTHSNLTTSSIKELENLVNTSLKISEVEPLKNVASCVDQDCFVTPQKLIRNSIKSGNRNNVKADNPVAYFNSCQKVGKVTPYSFSGRKLKPIILLSDDETSSDECPVVRKPSDQTVLRSNSNKVASKYSFLKSLSPSVSESNAHQRALDFRKNFHRSKAQLAQFLYHMFNKKIFSNKLPTDMTLEWSPFLTSTAGYCKTRRHGNTTSCSIFLSTKVLTSADRLRDTLLHEMCHAAVSLISKTKEAHGPMWRTWALRCVIAFPEVKVPGRCHNYDVTYKYSYKCTSCQKVYGRHKQSIDVSRHRCGKCRGTLLQL